MPYPLENRRILITGATGFLGRHLTPALLDRTDRVEALIRTPAKARDRLPEEVEWHVGDMTEPETWPAAVTEADVIIHAANLLQGDPELMHAVNVEGTRSLARRAAEGEIDRFLFVSSVMVYGFSAPPVVDETTSYGSDQDAYGASKVEAEQLLLEMHEDGVLDPVIVEPSAIYGPHDETWTLTPFELARDGWMLLPDGDRNREHPVFVDDVVRGIFDAIERGRPGERYIISGPEPMTLERYFGRYAEMVGSGEVTNVPGWLLGSLIRMLEWTAPLTGREPPLSANELRYLRRRSSYSHRKAAEQLDFEPQVDLDAGIARARDWLIETDRLVPDRE